MIKECETIHVGSPFNFINVFSKFSTLFPNRNMTCSLQLPNSVYFWAFWVWMVIHRILVRKGLTIVRWHGYSWVMTTENSFRLYPGQIRDMRHDRKQPESDNKCYSTTTTGVDSDNILVCTQCSHYLHLTYSSIIFFLNIGTWHFLVICYKLTKWKDKSRYPRNLPAST